MKQLICSSIGKKYIMAVTGIGLILFLAAHLLGNLSIYGGPESLNAYAEFLHSKPTLVWIFRIGLIALFVTHIFTGILLYLENWRARPRGYVKSTTVQATVSSRTMVWTGSLILIFLLYHLAHFTLRIVSHAGDKLDAAGRYDEFFMVTASFGKFSIVAAYIGAMVALWFHLRHGITSHLQTIGFLSPNIHVDKRSGVTRPDLQNLAGIFVATLVVAGFISIPLLVFLGLLGGTEQ